MSQIPDQEASEELGQSPVSVAIPRESKNLFQKPDATSSKPAIINTKVIENNRTKTASPLQL